jgi:phage portal protein BeeE
LERISAAGRTEKRLSVDGYLSEYLAPSSFTYGNTSYPLHGLTQTLAGTRIQQVATSLPGYAMALRACPPAFAAQMVRALVLSQARFTWRNRPWSNTPRRLFGTADLSVLERPWPKATTGDLLSLMEWHAGLTGNAYVIRQPNRLRVLRPDWCALIWGSQQEPDEALTALDGELIGLVYQNGGLWTAGGKPQTMLPDEFAHWAPIPDPEFPGMGQSWVTAALQDIQADRAATEHKFKFFTNGATPNMVVKGIPATTKGAFDEIVDMLEERHTGVANAYKTLYLTAGADATVVGSDLRQLDFKSTQGAGETRIAMLGRVPAPLLGISEGLAGSSLNAGNFGMARRIFADSWIYPSLQNIASSLEPLLTVPSNPRSGQADAELWFDTADMPLLREDARDAADIEQVKAVTITTYVKEGFTPDSAVAAVNGQDVTLLKHTGLTSVQLQPPLPDGAAKPDPPAINPPAPSARAIGPGSNLQYGPGSALWSYWTKGEGFAKWSGAVHKWETLRRLLLEAGVPEHEVDGLTTNIIEATMPGYMKQAHKKKA